MSTYYDWPQLVIISFVIKQTFKNVHVYVFVYHLNIDYNLHQLALDFKQIWQHYTCSKNQLNKKNMLINSFYKLLPLHHTFTKKLTSTRYRYYCFQYAPKNDFYSHHISKYVWYFTSSCLAEKLTGNYWFRVAVKKSKLIGSLYKL